jgi:hypothetical protein
MTSAVAQALLEHDRARISGMCSRWQRGENNSAVVEAHVALSAPWIFVQQSSKKGAEAQSLPGVAIQRPTVPPTSFPHFVPHGILVYFVRKSETESGNICPF